jgi:type III secretory pathway component EscT
MEFWKIIWTVFTGLIVISLFMITGNLATLVKVLAQIRDLLGPMRTYFDRKNQQAEEAEREFRRRGYGKAGGVAANDED